ncbi:acyltransferase [Siphonobacter sp. BAB-5405]|uniref:acyltransferase family protein n=1 Tax=Siphonobacter sp. BAB-5405 TaxID=1864825 RepID=UPI000C80A01B|nr:acyltransferase [Siphonobacter sp. BAB-5405]PMD90207.1 acyltransferase [Siphonobacter sp. BAB-5405]
MPNQSAFRNRFVSLDLLRSIAITMVYLFHYGRLFKSPAWITDSSSFGWAGVDLFFVLSGFLIATPLLEEISQRHTLDLKTFFIKRFFRILPAYGFVLALYYFFPLVRERGMLAPLHKYLTFTQNINLDILHHSAFSHAWSLCVEEQFYLFFPLLLLILLHFRLYHLGQWVLFGFFCFGVLIRYLSWSYVQDYQEGSYSQWYIWVYFPTYTRLDGLLVGISLAALHQYRAGGLEKLRPYAAIILVSGLLVLTAGALICTDLASFTATLVGFPIVALGYGTIVLSLILLPKQKFPGRKLWRMLAELSYSMYLSHKIVIHLTQRYAGEWGLAKDGNAMFLLCTLLTVGVAYLMHIAIERPFLQLRHKVLPAPVVQVPHVGVVR